MLVSLALHGLARGDTCKGTTPWHDDKNPEDDGSDQIVRRIQDGSNILENVSEFQDFRSGSRKGDSMRALCVYLKTGKVDESAKAGDQERDEKRLDRLAKLLITDYIYRGVHHGGHGFQGPASSFDFEKEPNRSGDKLLGRVEASATFSFLLLLLLPIE